MDPLSRTVEVALATRYAVPIPFLGGVHLRVRIASHQLNTQIINRRTGCNGRTGSTDDSTNFPFHSTGAACMPSDSFIGQLMAKDALCAGLMTMISPVAAINWPMPLGLRLGLSPPGERMCRKAPRHQFCPLHQCHTEGSMAPHATRCILFESKAVKGEGGHDPFNGQMCPLYFTIRSGAESCIRDDLNRAMHP